MIFMGVAGVSAKSPASGPAPGQRPGMVVKAPARPSQGSFKDSKKKPGMMPIQHGRRIDNRRKMILPPPPAGKPMTPPPPVRK